MNAFVLKKRSKMSSPKRSYLHSRMMTKASRSMETANDIPSLQAKCACGGGCIQCQSNLPIQAKLKISAPNDKYEQEADRMASQVMRMPAPAIQRKPD